MRRREFMTCLAAGTAFGLGAGPQLARAQAAKLPRIGILVLGNPDPAPFFKAFRDGLALRGYREGDNVGLEIRSAGGDLNRLREAAEELVRLPVDVLVVWQTPAATAAKQATRSIPIVMAAVGDPVGTGLVESLARPGGNITGLAGFGAELSGKNLELIRELMPGPRRIGVLLNGSDPFSKPLREQVEAAAAAIGLPAHFVVASRGDDLEAGVDELARAGVDVILAQPSLPQRRTVGFALMRRLPVVSANRGFVEAGGLMSYSSKADSIFIECATYVDRILKGAKPADLPVQGPKVFELVVNLKTATALGLNVPQTILSRADEVIE